MNPRAKRIRNTIVAGVLFTLTILLMPIAIIFRLLTDFFEAMECLFQILTKVFDEALMDIEDFIHRGRK